MAADGYPTMTSAYERVKPVVDELDERFYGLLDTCDRYADLLDELIDDQRGREQPDPELIRRFSHQRREVDELRERLESAPMDTFLRILDRILMIKLTEEGRFL